MNPMVSWSDPLHVVLNVTMTVVWLVALVDLFKTPRERWYNRRGKVLQVLIVLGLSLYIRGVFVPLGAFIWFARRGPGWLGLSGRDAVPTEAL